MRQFALDCASVRAAS